jgi:hypothetical protein
MRMEAASVIELPSYQAMKIAESLLKYEGGPELSRKGLGAVQEVVNRLSERKLTLS